MEMDRGQFDDHCFLVINNEDWKIGSIDNDWKTGKRWMRLWRDEPDAVTGKFNIAFVSLDMSRVLWDDYAKMACELLEEEICQTTGKTAPSTSRTRLH